MLNRSFVVVIPVVAFVLAACSSNGSPDALDQGTYAESEHPLCHMATSPEALQNLVPAADVCQCGGGDPAPETGDPVETVTDAPASVFTSDAYAVEPLLHGSKGGVCKTKGFCTVEWTKQKIKELAACIGIACAGVGGGGDISKAMIDIAKAVCCVKPSEARKHEEESKKLKDLVNKVCVGGK